MWMPATDWTVLARVDRSRGRRGELLATSFTGDPERISRAASVFAVAENGEAQGPYAVEEVWEHQGRLVIKLGGVDTIDAAERFRGKDICVPKSGRLPAEEGSYHLADLVGYRVEDASGALIGNVEGWQETGGPLLLEVRSVENEEILIPFAKQLFVAILEADRRMVVNLPEGLKELNRP
jgi:16S rRNA processing protein RimM